MDGEFSFVAGGDLGGDGGGLGVPDFDHLAVVVEGDGAGAGGGAFVEEQVDVGIFEAALHDF